MEKWKKGEYACYINDVYYEDLDKQKMINLIIGRINKL